MQLVSHLFNGFFLAYAVLISFSYILLTIISFKACRKYLRKNKFTNYDAILTATFSPSVSLIAPAYNEGANIIENVRSLLSLHYNNYQVIIVNDGSKDDSMEKLISAYDLYPTPHVYKQVIQTKRVKNIYKSSNPALDNLLVVDKENGGKADALNVGLNISTCDLVACIDVDCVLEQDSILKLVKPFMESVNKKVIATGGVVRIANSCEIRDGKLIKVHLPEKFIPRVQTLEYLRAFILGRMAWAEMNGLLIISGAFGMFDRKIAIIAGGYNHKTVGEDMELVVRMQRYCYEHKIDFRVKFIPDPLCWTEAPENHKILSRQRNRWTRGTIETLLFHRKMIFNPKYGLLGMISFPYWLLFEWLGPVIEFIGLAYFAILAIMGLIHMKLFLALLLAVYCFALMISSFALFLEEFTYFQYKSRREMLTLFITALLEPIAFHPFMVWYAIKGNYDYIRGKKSWGEMTRKGLGNK